MMTAKTARDITNAHMIDVDDPRKVMDKIYKHIEKMAKQRKSCFCIRSFLQNKRIQLDDKAYAKVLKELTGVGKFEVVIPDEEHSNIRTYIKW